MNRKRTRASQFNRMTRLACTSLVAVSVLLPAGLARAETSSGTYDYLPVETRLKIAAGEIPMPGTTAPDPSQAKITKEQAVGKVKALLPELKDAVAQNITLGVTNVYPPPPNQMVWNIEWTYPSGSMGYGFSSQVDALTGELISIYLSVAQEANENYYPPKLTRDQALEAAKAFIVKAAPSITLSDLKQEGYSSWGLNETSLFGPVQYSFYFSLLKNGIPSPEYVNVSLNGNGDLISFSKSYDQLNYPEKTAAISQAVAEQTFAKGLDVELSYIPIYKDNKVSKYILAWNPSENATYPIDALTGKRLSYQGEEANAAPTVYAEVPAGKKQFAPRTAKTELTADEAKKLVEQVFTIPKGRTLLYSSLDSDYADPERKLWRLTWGEQPGRLYAGGFSSQTIAEVDALTGQILEFRMEDYAGMGEEDASSPPAGAVKLSQATVRQKAIELVNALAPNASRDYRLAEQKETNSNNQNKKSYGYHFTRFVQGIPVSNGGISLSFDLYGNLKYYSFGRTPGLDQITGPSTAKVAKEEALKAYRDLYVMKLQYMNTGGHFVDNNYIEQKTWLAYGAESKNPDRPFQVIDAVSGQWVTTYDNIRYGDGNLSVTVPADVKGHPAEQDLMTLIQHRVIVPDESGNVKPNQEVTVGEWLGMMAQAVTPYYKDYGGYYGMGERKPVSGVPVDSPYYNAVAYAAQYKWIERDAVLKVDSKLTREELAVMLTTIVKYNKLAAFLAEDESLNQFSDKSLISSKGEVALAVKLGLLQGQNGKFNPQGTVTKADAATVIMQLVKLQGKTDQTVAQ
ncbi:S-layer homology domain-containing protein [Paenibacillus vini]|uniref:S-layer homology domain-containing protein n=1 Tax=Paenibacillus vini TaxID=1476024 RepID=UPI0025B658A6|nr:S-layer homology domain-containing protein [Paenibacillus vini]MDN4067945.1 S-layer homology domain-containing protein [Paenibacillus vini]